MIIGNAFEYLPKQPDNSVDLVLTDPPYNLPFSQYDWLLSEFLRISKTGAIAFCDPANQWPKADQYLFWIKPTSTKNTSKRYSRFVEMVCVYGDVKWITGRNWAQYTNVFTDLVDDAKTHPFRKPPSLIERLLLNHSNPGDKILDPFAGSGVIEEVCKRLDRKCVSIEIDEQVKGWGL